jgi:hypothetical protein
LIRIEGFIPCGSVAVIKEGRKPEYKYLMRTTTPGFCPEVVD